MIVDKIIGIIADKYFTLVVLDTINYYSTLHI